MRMRSPTCKVLGLGNSVAPLGFFGIKPQVADGEFHGGVSSAPLLPVHRCANNCSKNSHPSQHSGSKSRKEARRHWRLCQADVRDVGDSESKGAKCAPARGTNGTFASCSRVALLKEARHQAPQAVLHGAISWGDLGRVLDIGVGGLPWDAFYP